MRKILVLATIVTTLAVAAPASASENPPTALLSGEGLWLAGPSAGADVAGSRGVADVGKNGATVTIQTTGLVPGHAMTAWVAYYNDAHSCFLPDVGISRCGFFDLLFGNGGVVFGAGHVVGGSGRATFSTRINVGDGPDIISDTPAFDPTAALDLVVIVRSHGPAVPGLVATQLSEVFGGCTSAVGPPPGLIGGAIPEAPGECGDMQVFVFESPLG